MVVVIDKRSTRRDFVRIGTLSWSGDAADTTYLTSTEFVRSLSLASPHIHPETDLILCAGRRVIHTRHSDELRPERIVPHTGGTPILFEWYEEDADDEEVGEWWLVHSRARRPIEVKLRSEQIVRRSNDEPIKFVQLSSEIARGRGVIKIRQIPLWLVLLICGENRSIGTSSERSVLRGQVRRRVDKEALRKVLGGRWISLNPAHRPYWPVTPRRGAGNVCAFNGTDAAFTRLVRSADTPRRDGTKPPCAVVHANTYLPEAPRTTQLSSLVFADSGTGRTKTLRPESGPFPVDAPGVVTWRYLDYVLRWSER